MATSRQPGPQCSVDGDGLAGARTPGSLGMRDAAQPWCPAFQGDTPGALGAGTDAGALLGVCQAPPHATFDPAQRHEAANDQGSAWKDAEVWIFDRRTLFVAMGLGAAYASTFKDTVTLTKLLRDFGITGRYYLTVIKGKEHVVFKGYAGLREAFTAPHYLKENPLVVKMAVGRAGVIEAGKDAAKLTAVLVVAADVAEFAIRALLGDKEKLSELGVKIFSDLTKGMIATATGVAAGMVAETAWMAAAGALTGVAAAPVIVPLFASIAVGIVVSVGLEYIDHEFGLTQKLQEYVNQQSMNIAQLLDEAERTLNAAGRALVDTARVLLETKRDVERLIKTLEQLEQWLAHPLPRLGL